MESEKHKKTVELGDIFSVAWKRKWLIVIPLILVSIIAFFASYLITPEYQSSIIIWLGNPVRLSDQLRRLVGDAGNVLGEDRHRSEELRSLQNEITSTPYMQQLISRLKLDQNPKLDNQVQKIRASRPDLSSEQIRFDLIYNDLVDRININYAGWEQVRITVQSPDPYTARDMAQNLGEILMAEKMKQELGSVRMSQDFTYEQLSKFEKDLQNKIDEKTNFEKKYMGVQFSELAPSDSNRKAINAEIEGTNSDIEEKKSEERQLLARLSDIPTATLFLNESANLKKIKGDIQSLLTSVANLMPKYRWSDPEILSFKTKLYNFLAAIENENRQIVETQFKNYDKATRDLIVQLFNVRANLDVLNSKLDNLRVAMNSLNERVSSYPEYQARLDQLAREVISARDIRDRFKEQQQSSQISQALLSESRFEVIEPAKVPLKPVTPNRPKILVAGIVLGLLIGAGAALLAELLDTTVKSVEEVENDYGFPVLGVIPQIESLKKASKLKTSS